MDISKNLRHLEKLHNIYLTKDTEICYIKPSFFKKLFR